MQIEPMKFKEFGPDMAPFTAKIAKTFLPGGRMRGEVPPPPPPPTFSEEQLKAAERDAYKKGFVEGTQDGINQTQSEQAEVEKKIAAQLEQFAAANAPLLADYRTTIMQIQQEIPKIALAIAKKVAGQALAENAGNAIEDIALRCVETMAGEPKLTVTVHPSLVERLERHMQQLATHLRAVTDISVIGDANMAMENCRIEWQHGSFVRDTGKLWEEIGRTVEGMVASVQHQAQTHLDTTLQAQLPATTEPTQTTKE